jgi:hypothetical protein
MFNSSHEIKFMRVSVFKQDSSCISWKGLRSTQYKMIATSRLIENAKNNSVYGVWQ